VGLSSTRARNACLHRASAHRLPLSKVTEELIGETARVREREEMATRKLVDADVQSFLCDATLELDRKEPIVASGDHMDRDRRPGLESAGLAEHDVGLGALVRFSSFHDVMRNVVQEVRGAQTPVVQ
jgi:hypothetical protein